MPSGTEKVQLPWLRPGSLWGVTYCDPEAPLGSGRNQHCKVAPLLTCSAAPLTLPVFPGNHSINLCTLNPHLRICFWGTSSKTLFYSSWSEIIGSFPPWSSTCLLQISVGFGHTSYIAWPKSPCLFQQADQHCESVQLTHSVCWPSEVAEADSQEPVCLPVVLGSQSSSFVCNCIGGGVKSRLKTQKSRCR